jgi:hypothetical protein
VRFDAVWSELVARLRPGLVIPNWTQDKGHFGEDFRVVMAEPGGVVVAPPGAKHPQTIGKAEFERVFGLWPGYLTGAIRRMDLRDVTRYSKYVISLFRWLEGELGKPISGPGVTPGV